MQLTTNNKTYAGITFRLTADGCVITAQEAITPGDTLIITADDGAELCRYTVSDWLRCEIDEEKLTLSDSPKPEPVPPDLDALRGIKQAENKAALADWLATHPLIWKDGQTYGVTQEDQDELSLNLMQYQLAVQTGQAAQLEWHAQKQACRAFTSEEYAALSLAIAAYVYPYRRYQEQIKAAIYAAESEDEIHAVQIDYSSVS